MIQRLDWNYFDKKYCLDWIDDTSYLMSVQEVDCSIIPTLPGHLWIKTSGTTGKSKWIALSKKAFLSSAKAVNDHLEIGTDDSWLHALPLYHVGGLSILCRSYLSGSNIYEGVKENKWDANFFVQKLNSSGATLSALVPTQLFDIISLNLKAPATVRSIIIGGARLAPDLHQKAVQLGWPVLASFGMTETCSQVATSIDPSSLNLIPLNHVQFKTDDDGHLWIKGDSLLSGIWSEDGEWSTPIVDGWYKTEDQGFLENGILNILGRKDDVEKILGEKVSLVSLADKVKKYYELEGEVICLTVPDERRGFNIIAVIESIDKIQLDLDKFNKIVSGPEKILSYSVLDLFPRNAMGKIQKNKINI